MIDCYQTALRQNGFRNWWPGGGSAIEIAVGAVLAQNTAWKNAREAVERLRGESMLDALSLQRISEDRLAMLIRPAGYYNQKARKIKEFMQFLSQYDFDWKKLRVMPVPLLRRKMLDVWGLGPETVDSILLYALDREVFVIDAYTYRISTRHGWINQNQRYNEKIYMHLQAMFFESVRQAYPKRVLDISKDFHAQIVYIGHHYCKSHPRCDGCPWQRDLDHRA